MVTVNDIIAEAELIIVNDVPEDEKRKIVAECDQYIYDQIFNSNPIYHPVDIDPDYSDELLIDTPYSKIYLYYLIATMCLHNNDIDTYSLYYDLYTNMFNTIAKKYIEDNGGKTYSFKNMWS